MKPQQYLLNEDKSLKLKEDEFVLRAPINYLNHLYKTHKDLNVAGNLLLNFLAANKDREPFYLLLLEDQNKIPFDLFDQMDFQLINEIDKLYIEFNLEPLTIEIEAYFPNLKTNFNYGKQVFVINTLFDHIGRQIRRKKRFYESDLLYALKSLINKGDTCIDVGANIGNHTLFFSTICEKIIAIEPLEDNLIMLKHNVADNGLKERVTIIDKAMSKDGRKMRTGDTPAWNRGMCNMVEDNTEEQTITPETILPFIENKKLDILKIDCEAMSMEIFEAFLTIIKQHSPILIIEASDEELAKIKNTLPNYSIYGKYNATPTYILKSN